MRYRFIALLAFALVVSPSHHPQGPASDAVGSGLDRRILAASSSAAGDGAYRLRHLQSLPAFSPPSTKLEMHRPEIEISADDRVYIADAYNYRICIYDLTGSQQSCFGKEGTGPGQFRRIQAMRLAPDGSLLVQDIDRSYNESDPSTPGRLQRFTAEGSFLDSRRLPFFLVAIGPDGDFYGWNDKKRLVRQDSSGQIVEWGPNGPEDDTAFLATYTFVVDRRGHLFMALENMSEVRHYDPSGRLLTSWAPPEATRDRFMRGFALRVSADGTLVMVSYPAVDFEQLWVQRFTPDGDLLGAFRPAHHDTDVPFGPAFTDFESASDGSILILSVGDAIVQRYSPEGQRLALWLNEGSGPQMLLPSAITLLASPDGSLRSIGRDGTWVDISPTGVVAGRGRLQVPPEVGYDLEDATRSKNGDICAVASTGDAWCFEADGSVRTHWRWSEEQGSRLAGSIAAAPDGSLWLSDPIGAVLQHVDTMGRALGETSLPIPPQLRLDICPGTFGSRLGVAVAPDGTVLVAEQCTRQLRQPASAPGIHRVSSSGEFLSRREIPDLLGLDPGQSEATINDLDIGPAGEILLTTHIDSIAAKPPPADAIWLLDSDGGVHVMDPGHDPDGLRIQPNHLALAGKDRLWTTRGENLGDHGTLDAFALEAGDALPPVVQRHRILLPYLER